MRPMREPEEPEGRDVGNGSFAFPPPSVRGLFGLSSDISDILFRWTKSARVVKGTVQAPQLTMTRPTSYQLREIL